MGYWEISKSFEFDYGHRVWTQKLEEDFSIDTSCACKYLHGHRGKIIVYLKSNQLNLQGMVTDFKHLNWFKKWVDEVLDHRFIMDTQDPLCFSELSFLDKSESEIVFIPHLEGYLTINPETYENLDGGLREKYEGMVFVNFVPTSENLSKWIFEVISERMSKIGVLVSKIEFYETPKSKSTFIGN